MLAGEGEVGVIVMATTAVRWASLRPPQCATSTAAPVCKCHSFRGRCVGRRKCCSVPRRRSGQRGSVGRRGAFDDTRSEPVMNGTANSSNEFGTLALLFSHNQGDDGSFASRQELSLNLRSESDESNEYGCIFPPLFHSEFFSLLVCNSRVLRTALIDRWIVICDLLMFIGGGASAHCCLEIYVSLRCLGLRIARVLKLCIRVLFEKCVWLQLNLSKTSLVRPDYQLMIGAGSQL